MEADSDPDCLGRARYAKVVDCNAEPLKDGNDAYRCAKVDIKTTLRQAGRWSLNPHSVGIAFRRQNLTSVDASQCGDSL